MKNNLDKQNSGNKEAPQRGKKRDPTGEKKRRRAAAAVSPLEERVRALSLRQLEAVCEANGVSSSGSRAEMLSRLLARGAAGHPIDFGGEAPPEAPPPQQLSPPPQQLSVPTRWDGDEAEDIDGDDIDGEDIDGEDPASSSSSGSSSSEEGSEGNQC